MKNRFQKLWQYTDWANSLVIEFIKDADNLPPRALEIMSHVVRAQEVWFERVTGEPETQDFWKEIDPDNLVKRSRTSIALWLDLLEHIQPDQLDKKISYQNSKGVDYQTALDDIVSHVINHSTHHRAQVVQLIRQADLEPPATDYIAFTRR